MTKQTNLTILLIIGFVLPFGVEGQTSNSSKSIIKKHRIVFNQPPRNIPSAFAVDAPLLGNGFTGVAISGEPEKQVYYLASNDFWRLKSSFNQSFPAVLGKLNIEIPELKDATYKIEQDLYNAQTYSKFTKNGNEVNFKTYVAAHHDVMLIEINYTGENEIRGEVNLELPGKNELVDKPPFDLIFPTETDSGITNDGVLYISRAFTEDVDIKTQATCAAKIIGSKLNSFQLKNGTPVYIIAAFSSNFKSENCLQEVKSVVSDFQLADVAECEKVHKRWWVNFWNKSWVEIPDKTIEKQYYLSNYTLASCSRDPKFPPSIFGAWITRERPGWNGDYHLNYNHFAPFYGLFSSNHLEQALPCNMPLLAIMERGEYYSKKVCGIENGMMLPVGIGPLGIETVRRNELMETHRSDWIKHGNVEDDGLFYGQKSNSSYAVVNMAAHFYSCYNKEVAQMYYPFVKAVATFWENYLTFEKGRFVIYNDAIHEGTVGTKNPILSLGMIPMVLETAIDMGNELGIDANRHEKWKHILENLSDYSYQRKKGKKVFRYTEKGTAWWKNNTLGIQHIYPAGQIGLDSNKDLLKVAWNTIDVMQRWVDHNGSNSFFPAAVRVGYNPNVILDQLNTYVKNTLPNGFQKGNPHGIENLSTVPNTINEMLCMGHGGILRLFPVWPKQKDAAFFQLRVHGAFLISSILKTGDIKFVKIESEQGRTCVLVNPWPGNKVKVESNLTESKDLSGERLTIKTQNGEILILTKGN